jgi:hypothetical protein
VEIYEPESSMDTSKDGRFEAYCILTFFGSGHYRVSLEQGKELIDLAIPLPPSLIH